MSSSVKPVPTTQKSRFSVALSTKDYQDLIHNTLRDTDKANRFVASISSAVAANPELQDCTAGSILTAGLLGESLNLSPSPQLGHYYIIPFEIKLKGPDGKTLWKVDENGEKVKGENGRFIAQTEKRAQFVLGYKGYIQLALRSGQYADIDVLEIKDGEYLGRDPFTGKPKFRFVDDDIEREALRTIGYMAYFEYLNGFRKVLYWSYEKMQNHADMYSPAYSAEAHRKIMAGEIKSEDMWKYSSFWYKNFDDMAMKTLLRQLISRWGIMSIEMQKAFDADVISGDGQQLGLPSAAQSADMLPEARNAVPKIDLSSI